jgi:ribosomal protein S19E (S16A)
MPGNDKEDLKKVKTRLAKVKKDTEYNNTFRRTLQQIKSEYPIVVTEEGEVIKLSGVKVMDVVANNITELSEEQKAELVALLQNNTTEEVA